MVGRETFLIAVAGFPAMKFLGSVSVSAVSGPLAGRASGTLPGQIGIWVCPDDGCQTGCWERRVAQADRMQRVRSRGFIGVPGTRISAVDRSKAEGHLTGRGFVEERKCRTGAGKGTLGGGSAGGGLAGTAAEGSVGAGRGALGERAGFAALRTQASRHPFARAERAFEQRGYPEIGVELFEVQAQAGRSEFHVAELRGGRPFQPLGIFRRKEDAETVGEFDDYTLGFAVVVGRSCKGSAGAERIHALARFFEFLTRNTHASPSMPRRERRRAVRVS